MDPRRHASAESDGRHDEQDGHSRQRSSEHNRTGPCGERNQPHEEGATGGCNIVGGTYDRAHIGSKYTDNRNISESHDYGNRASYRFEDRREVHIHLPHGAAGHPAIPGQFGYRPAIAPPQNYYAEAPGGRWQNPVNAALRPSWSDMVHPALTSQMDFQHQYVPPHPRVEPLRTVKKLTEAIEAYTDQPISKKAHVYPGKQSMGLVHARDVAIKVVSFTDRKMREAKNLVKLTPHANVVAVIHADLIQDFEKRLYIVMEMCNPLTLEEYITKRKKRKIPFNPNEAIEFSRQLIEGMNHIHQNNIIHRDLKPSSVLFSVCGKFLKIIDFGMSKALNFGCSTMSLSTLPIGTDGFRAPETYNENRIKKESDIFSLAILLYHVWSYGYHPFGNISLWSYNIKEKNPPVLSDLLVPNQDSAKELLVGMLVNEPVDRFTINTVRTHPFNAQVMNDTLTKSCEALWTGSIVVPATDFRAKFDDCVIYKEKAVEGSSIDSRWKLELNNVPKIASNLLHVPVEKTPEGYLGIKQACAKCLRDYLAEKDLMSWINVLDHQGKRTRSLLLIRPPDYDEIYGVLVRNPERLISACESNVQGVQETAPKEHAEEVDAEQSIEDQQQPADADATVAMAEDTTLASSSSGQGQELAEPMTPGEEVEDVTPHQAVPRLSIPIGHLALIPFWIHDPSGP